MRTESKEVVGDVVDKVIEATKNLEKQLRELAETNYPLTEVRVNLETNQVFVVWKDYSEEEQRIIEMTKRAIEIKERLASVTDEIERAVLESELGKLDEEYVKLAQKHIYEVI